MLSNFMRKIISVLIILVFFQVLYSQVSAYNTFNQHKLKNGVGNYGNNTQYYWINSSASTYTSLIDSAWSDWIYTSSRLGISTPISFRKTTIASTSVVDFFEANDNDGQTLGWTEFIVGSNLVNPYNTNWDYARIRINKPVFNTLTSYHKKGTVAHEIGHAMGLAHTTSSTYIMTQYGAGRTVNTAQPNDLAGINFLY